MKKYISILCAAFASMSLLSSCDKDTEGMTWITYYPNLVLDGSKYINWTAGTPYVDPGYSAELDGEDVTADVIVTSSMNMADPAPGVYTITYSIANADGISATAVRNVVVATAGDNVSGFYTTQTDSYRNYGGNIVYYGGYPVSVYGDGSGVYEVSDMFGGWYQYRAGYGINYAMQGLISIVDGVVTLEESYLNGWGDSIDELTNGSFDEATNTLSWDVAYAGVMVFTVNLSK